jgi:hypothetical protein
MRNHTYPKPVKNRAIDNSLLWKTRARDVQYIGEYIPFLVYFYNNVGVEMVVATTKRRVSRRSSSSPQTQLNKMIQIIFGTKW